MPMHMAFQHHLIEQCMAVYLNNCWKNTPMGSSFAAAAWCKGQHTRTIFPFSPCVPGTPASSVPLLMIQLHFQGCWPCAWTLLTPVLSSPSARLHDPSCQPRLTLTVLRSPLTMDGGRREPKSQSGCAETKSGFVLYNIHFRVALCI